MPDRAQLGWRWIKTGVMLRCGLVGRFTGLACNRRNGTGLGSATWVSTRVTVLDKDLGVWRKAHPAGTALPVSEYPVRPHVYNTLLINVDQDLAEVECSGLPQRFPAPQAMRLDDFASAFRERVLPVLDLFQSPALVARELPVSWLDMITYGTI